MHRILLGTGYRSYSQRGVLQVRPIEKIDPTQHHLLKTKLPTFGGGMSTTIQGLGAILYGYTINILFPGRGTVGDILAPFNAEKHPALRPA